MQAAVANTFFLSLSSSLLLDSSSLPAPGQSDVAVMEDERKTDQEREQFLNRRESVSEGNLLFLPTFVAWPCLLCNVPTHSLMKELVGISQVPKS